MKLELIPAESRVSLEDDYIRAEICGRQTASETRKFLESVVATAVSHGCWRVLISVKKSRPLFRVDRYGLSEYFQLMARKESTRVALLGDSEDVCASHEYIELLARHSGVHVRSFRNEGLALEWLREG